MASLTISESHSAAPRVLRARMPELDTLRGIAVLSVVLFHSFGFRYGTKGLTGIPKIFVSVTLGGWAGVNLFFVLSGFLITGILLDTRGRKDYYRRFYIRRALRILPLYYAILIVLAVVSSAGILMHPISWSFLGLSAIYLANVTGLFGVPMQFGTLWSLAVEEHFYLLWPTAARFFSRYWLAVLAVAICFVCPALRALYGFRGYDTGSGYTWLCADGLAMGALLAIFLRSRWGNRLRLKQLAIGSLIASLAIFAVGAPFGILLARRWLGFIFRETTLDLFFLGIIASTLLIGTSRWKAIVNRPALEFIGEISYGVYLIHRLVRGILDGVLSRGAPNLWAAEGNFPRMLLLFCVTASSTGIIAWLSRWYFEEPFLRLKERFESTDVEPELSSPKLTRVTEIVPQPTKN